MHIYMPLYTGAKLCRMISRQNNIHGLFCHGVLWAPIHLWRFCIICAVFINNITATFFSKEKVWATPFELMHGEPYPDSGIVVPFGCGCLVLLREEEREKFKPKCALMVFIHYALNHPLYTYALYSPKTKKVLYRQDVIFLPNVFPMREARMMGHLVPEGEKLVTYRSRQGRVAANTVAMDSEVSFEGWTDQDDLPLYEDHVTGFQLGRPKDDTPKDTVPRGEDWPTYSPDTPSFGPKSCVKVPAVWEILKEREWRQSNDESSSTVVPTTKNGTIKQDNSLPMDKMRDEASQGNDRGERTLDSDQESNSSGEIEPRRSGRKKDELSIAPTVGVSSRRPVKERWYYEAVVPAQMSNVMKSSEHIKISESSDNLQHDVIVLNDKLKHFGPIKLLSEEDIEEIEDNETGACYLHGTLFYDDELDWCRVTGWGAECGTMLVYYAPVTAIDPTLDEHHASLRDVLIWIKDSPPVPITTGYKSSRTLKRSTRTGAKCLFTRILACATTIPQVGSLDSRPGPRLNVTSKLLSARTIRKCQILYTLVAVSSHATVHY